MDDKVGECAGSGDAHGRGGIARILLLVVMMLGPAPLLAQDASLQGIVTSAGDGGILVSAQVFLEADGELVRSIGTDRNGLYLIGGLAPGTYTLHVRTLGYAPFARTINLAPGERATVHVRLEIAPLTLEGVDVEARGPEGAAIRDFGVQRIAPTEIRRVPTPAAAGDLAAYVQTLPGVVTTGDRGGQLYVRGGTHTENMTVMDGLTVYQPFHIVGFFSAFPEELVSNVDFYAGGFGARYFGRTSSVMDVRMRDGNRERYSGAVSVSPFLAEARFEGPLDRGVSWIGSFRHSLIDRTSDAYLSSEQPVSFGSQYLKVTGATEENARCSAVFLRTTDEGRLDPQARGSRLAWSNLAVGGRCTGLLEDAQSFLDLNLGYSSVTNEAVAQGAAELLSDVSKIHAELVTTRLLGLARIEFGYRGEIETASYRLTELFGRSTDREKVTRVTAFVDLGLDVSDRLTMIPGVVVIGYPHRGAEPRFRMTWRPGFVRGGELTGAAGLYSQDLMGVSDVRDVGSIFVAWMPVPDEPMKSIHGQLGWQQRLAGGVNWSVEGYYRRLRNVGVPRLGAIAEFETQLETAHGSAMGVDTRVEYLGNRFYGFLGYGLGRVEYESAQQSFFSWFGTPVLSYNPPHDRRHQLNAVLGYDLLGFDLSVRWQLATGLPYTRPLGFDEILDYRLRMPVLLDEPGTPRMIIDMPYRGRLPLVHRLDIAAERGFDLPVGRLEVQVGAINTYGRTNLFYYDLFTDRRVDQLPFAPYAAVSLRTR